jgi:hypothetical protein
MNANRWRALGCWALLALGAGCVAPPSSEKSFRVALRDGQFVERASGRPVALRGFNYIRLFHGHGTFDPAHYDGAAASAVFRRLHGDGFNVVRVFISTQVDAPGAVALQGQAGLSRDYLRNAADFLMRARRERVVVILSMEQFPRVSPYTERLEPLPASIHGLNAAYLAPGYLRAKEKYLGAFIAGLQQVEPRCLEAVCAYDLSNELCFFGAPPFTLAGGTVTAPNGHTYRLPEQRQALADDAAVFYINRMCAAIRAAQPDALVCAGVFTYRAVGKTGPGDFRLDKAGWKNRYPFRPLAILRSQADFLDLHFYPSNAAEFERDLQSIEFPAVQRAARELGKPVVAGEFGAFKGTFPTAAGAAQWMAELGGRYAALGCAGWLYWTLDTHEQSSELWHARDADDLIYRRLRTVLLQN